MSIFDRIDRHERLFSRMADMNGADLDLAMQSGRLAPDRFRGAVLSCTACVAPEDCEERINRGQTGLPAYCRNAKMICNVAELMSF